MEDYVIEISIVEQQSRIFRQKGKSQILQLKAEREREERNKMIDDLRIDNLQLQLSKIVNRK